MPFADPEKRKAYIREHYQANKEAYKRRSAAQRERLKQESDPWAYWRRYYRLNLVKKRAQGRKARIRYGRRHREKIRAAFRAWRAAKKMAAGTHSISQWLARVEFYGWRCFYCHRHLTSATLTCDHRIPLSKGGSNFASNLVPACKTCNSSKGDKKAPRIG